MDKFILKQLLIFYTWIIVCQTEEEKPCLGTSYGLTHGEAAARRYETYLHTYENCTYVDGNLEIVFLEEQNNYNLNFLSNIKEVTGYVLISSVYAYHVPLTNLRIIRGSTLYKSQDGNHYSLYISLNFKPGTKYGLKELGFKNLYEIMEGNVFFFNNNQLCYENTIRWQDILTKSSSRAIHHSNSNDIKRKCGECHSSCDGHCWGSEPDMCQELSHTKCAQQCDGSRCFGDQPSQCCHLECVGGCTGPTSRDCWACKNFNNKGVCVPFCPREKIYDSKEYKYVPNPDAKYTYGSLCVDECPPHLVIDQGACVRDCGPNKVANDDRRCVDCEGTCPKTCLGTNADKYKKSNFINAHNINDFIGCTVVNGNIRILTSSFNGDDHNNIPAMDPAQLSVLESVREINGYLMVQGEHQNFTSLSFFKNLKKIYGRMTDQFGYALQIFGTTLKTLELTSLKLVANGAVLVKGNARLCYASTINWSPLLNNPSQTYTVVTNQNNSTCYKENHTCSEHCSSDGCWGSGADHCLSCKNYILEGKCVNSCNSHLVPVYDAGNRECKKCHEQCKGGCTGPGSDQCDEGGCKNYRDGPYCVAMCPETKYPNSSNVCLPCHPNCRGGCTGPLNNLGENACNNCQLVLLNRDLEVNECAKVDPDSNMLCDVGSYNYRYSHGKNYARIQACAKCHPLCKRCWGSGASKCDECVHLSQDDICVENCTIGYYQHGNTTCEKCSSKCVDCYGPTAMQCLTCKQFKIYNKEGTKFNCTDKCPKHAPYKASEKNKDTGEVDIICTAEPVTDSSKGRTLGIIIGTLIAVAIIGVIIIVVAVYCQKRAKAIESKERLAARMSGLCEESEITPLTPTNATPDMATLRLIKESELRKGTMVGSGAFGTVYKGFWIPGGDNVKIPVAIKVLQEGTSTSQNHELLEEARVMASVDNKYCVPVLGVCMTAQMMLITSYMPLGCLLDYVRKNKDNTGSKALLDWCTQIAMGMAYLETRGIVHRDLAARNVLVQHPKRVRVTDFGLSKLLDVDTTEYHATGGKMPIKWLALECMQHRVFTHKSDVWSFGVTIWELFTYGSRPYENVRARDIPELLEKGERLPQPAICTIDVYMIMIKCWMLDAQSRPGFKELADEFSKMARDPGRYLVIHGDRLMRLPSHSSEVQRNLLRNISVAMDGGPEEIMDAEQYLNPGNEDDSSSLDQSGHRPRHYRSNGKLEKVREENSNSGGSVYDNDRSHHSNSNQSQQQSPMVNSLDTIVQPPPSPPTGTTGPGSHHHPDRKYGFLEQAAAAKKQREAEQNEQKSRDSMKTRYSSDPCKTLAPTLQNIPQHNKENGENYFPPAPPTPIANPTTDNVFFPPNPASGDNRGNTGKPEQQRLMLDEDDYLQPQSTSQMPNYIDVQEDYLPPRPSPNSTQPGPGSQGLPSPPYQQHQPLLQQPPDASNIFAQNPEYFDSPNSPTSDNESVSFNEKRPLTSRYSKNSPAEQPMQNPAQQKPYNPYSNYGVGSNSKNQNNHLSGGRNPQPGLSEVDGANTEHNYYNDTDYLNATSPARKTAANNKADPSKKKGMFLNPRTESVV